MNEQVKDIAYKLERKLTTIAYEMQDQINAGVFDYESFLYQVFTQIDAAVANGVNLDCLYDSSAIYSVLIGCMSAHLPIEVADLRKDVITYLIANGANVNVGYFGVAKISPLQIAEAERYTDIIKLLTDNGAVKIDKKTSKTPNETQVEKQ